MVVAQRYATVEGVMSDVLFLSVKQAAQRLGVGETLVKAAVSRGELKSTRWGARRLIHVRDIEEFAERLRGAAATR
jgi:excisionase family DNA binding protein